MELYPLLKWLHILGASVLFGTGAGIAFFMVWAHRTNNTETIALIAQGVVFADFLFTASAVIIQPLTGFLLSRELGIPLSEPWLILSLFLYAFVGLCWLPVVWLQIRMRDMAVEATKNSEALPSRYHKYFTLWFALGWPAFLGVLAIFWLMIAKPDIW